MDSQEREIDLRQLALLIMMQWRIITCVTLICMIIGALVAVNKPKTVKNHQNASETIGYDSDETYEYKKSVYKDLKLYYESQISRHLKQAENEKAYIENSLNMKVDPLNQVVGTAEVLISGTAELSSALALYQDMVRSDTFWQPLSEKYSIDPKYFREMCSIALLAGSSDNRQVVQLFTTTPEKKMAEETLTLLAGSSNNRQVVQLSTTMPEKKMAEEALTLLAGIFDKKGMELLQSSIYVQVDPYLAQFQQQTYSQLAQRYIELQDMYNNYDRLAEPKKVIKPGTREVTEVSSKPALLKGAFFGGVAGACGSAMFVAFSLFLPGRLLSCSEFFDKYQLNCLAAFPPQLASGHTLALDRRLLKWSDNSRFSRLDRMERFEVAATNIGVHVRDGESILLLGTIALPRIQEVRAGLAEQLTSCTVGAWRFVDQQVATLKEIDQYKHIILVEEVGTSKYQDVDNQMQVLQERGRNIVGCIML